MQSFVGVTIIFAFLAIASVMGDPAPTAPTKKPTINCHECNDCPDPFNANATGVISKKCDTGECFKYFHTDKRVQRGCAPKEDSCPEDEGGKFRFAYCYTCEGEDNCNSARRMIEALPLFTATVASFVGLAIWRSS